MMMKKYILPVVICLIVLGGSIGVLQWRSQDADTRMIADIESNNNDAAMAFENAVAPAQEKTVEITPARIENGAFVIGDKNSPITILEFSSLSCPHCATFHESSLSSLKKDYIESGKVKFVFNDFPLNKPAVDASLLLKCVDIKDRYDFMEILFSQQSQWAFSGDHQDKLKQYAALLGVSSDKADVCMSDTDAERVMFEQMRANNQKYQVKSTPTFVVLPSEKVITGAQNYGVFSTEIERLLSETN
jgi:protein-disulfide isomerase